MVVYVQNEACKSHVTEKLPYYGGEKLWKAIKDKNTK
jgi:hypothetical protein